MVGWPEQGASAAAPMDSGGKVAGVRHLGTTVRDSRSRAHREREENKANPSRGVLWLVGMANVAVRGGAMPAASGLVARAPGSLKSLRKRTGRERR